MAPTPAQISTWQHDCTEYNRTVAAWKAMQTQELAAFNKTLSENNLQPITVTPTPLTDPSCSETAKGK
ncbi:MAG TPA: hypothetical protein VFP94_04275, partial [Terriglobales bacterium]|nr:hypothetical protein [Terriglobales bacterium]